MRARRALRAAWPAGLITLAMVLLLAATIGSAPLPRADGDLALQRPGWLWLLVAMPTLFHLSRPGDGSSGMRWLAPVLLRALALAAIAFALARPTRVPALPPRVLVAAVDVSNSMSDEQLAAARQQVSAMQRQLATEVPPAGLQLVRFAAHAEPVRSPRELVRFDDAADGADTDVAAALTLAAARGRATATPFELVLLSDGRETASDVRFVLATLARTGIPVSVWQPPADDRADVGIVALTGPLRTKVGAPFELRAEVLAQVPAGAAAQARVVLMRDGVPVKDGERKVDLASGRTHVRWTAQLDEQAPALFEAHLQGANPNAIPDNDDAPFAVLPEPTARVLLVGESPTETQAMRQMLAAQKIESVAIHPAALRTINLDDHDLVLLANLPRTALPDAVVARLARHAEQGGGLVLTGGPSAFGAGGFHHTALERLLPVTLEVPGPRQQADLALALVVDRSGSMSGAKMELTKEAARQTAMGLPPEDLLAVIAFDSRAESIVRLQKAGNRQRILAQIDKVHAGGGTNILPALSEAYQQLLSVAAQRKHIILLSDGQSHAGGIKALVGDTAAAGITVSTVGVGSGADQTILRLIAERGGGRFHHTEDPASIPRIFSRETNEVRPVPLLERPTRLRVAHASPILRGLPLAEAPRLLGFNMTRARPQAELLLASDDGRPVLARWPLGLGQVAVWTSDLGPRWAGAFMRWPQAPAFFAQLARAVMRAHPDRQFPVELTVRGGRVEARIEASDADGQPLSGLVGNLRLSPWPGQDQTARVDDGAALVETSPGLYELSLPRPTTLPLWASARLTAPGQTGGGRDVLAQGVLADRRAREFAPGEQARGRAVLAQVARSTTGHWLQDGATPPPAPVRGAAPSAESLAPELFAFAIVLFVAAVGLRRATYLSRFGSRPNPGGGTQN